MRGTPIIIEPSHINYYNHNIVANNWVDCVTIEEREAGLQNEKVFDSTFAIYQLPQRDITPNTPLSTYIDAKDRNIYPVAKELTRVGFGGNSEKFFYYKAFVEKGYRTTTTFQNLVLEIDHSRVESFITGVPNELRYGEYSTKSSHVAGVMDGFKRYNSVADFENSFIDGNQMKSERDFAIGVVFSAERMDFCFIFRAARSYGGGTYLPRLSFSVKIYLDTFFEKKRTVRYRLNPATKLCEIAPDTFKAKYPHTHSSSEAIQSGATAPNKYNNGAIEPLSKVIANSILKQLERGKQSAEMSVKVLDYYDKDGNKVISPKELDRKLFKLCDWVIPYITEMRNGELVKVPMSKDRFGNPRVFEIYSARLRDKGMEQYIKMVEVIT